MHRMTLESRGNSLNPRDPLNQEIAAMAPWFHNLHLPNGIQTAPDHPLGDFPAYKWEQIAPLLATDLRGSRVLDIGCNAGYYSFELAKRGASVLAIDHDEHYLEQARWGAAQLGLSENVQFRNLDVYDLAQVDEMFDTVLFLGMLYHLRYPLLGLDLAAERARETLVVQTLTHARPEDAGVPHDVSYEDRRALDDPSWPSVAFVEHRFAEDPTNWWVPGLGAVEAMIRTTGFRVAARPGHEMWVCRRARDNEHRSEVDRATGRTRRASS